MSELNRFFRKPLEKEIEGRVWKFKSLGVKDMELFMGMTDTNDPKKMAEGVRKILTIYIKANIPDATDEEINELPIDFVMTFMDSVYIANGLADEEKAKLMDKVKGMQ